MGAAVMHETSFLLDTARQSTGTGSSGRPDKETLTTWPHHCLVGGAESATGDRTCQPVQQHLRRMSQACLAITDNLPACARSVENLIDGRV